MNIAIVLGVSTYNDVKNNLPGCKNDADAIFNIIKKTEKFESILNINDNEKSAKIKEQVINFIAEHKGKPIEELFFYYTGHGEFSNNEFYYILSDYDSKKRNQTSLQNTELDDLFRTLNPTLVIKVIDACQSGTSYIKDSDVLNKYFDGKKNGFQKCYFLNSSLNNQSSYQSEKISDFTQSFINAIKQHDAEEIRYKDIIDVIADQFDGNQDQTPFFVIQAEYTEKFCTINKSLKTFLQAFEEQDSKSEDQKDAPISLFDFVKEDAKNYTDKKGADEALLNLKKEIESYQLKGDLNKLFDINVDFLANYDNIPQKYVLTNWMEKNEHDFFADVVELAKYNPMTEEYEYEKNGFELKFDAPYKAISINMDSKFPNLNSYHTSIVFLLSKKFIRYFYFTVNFKQDNWESRELDLSDLRWITISDKITNLKKIKTAVDYIFNGIESRITKDIENKLNLDKDKDDDDLPF